MTDQVALIFGYGPRVGTDVAQAFAARGYRVAVVSRSNKSIGNGENYHHIKADLSDPRTVEDVFSQVTSELGHPTVVIYNGMQSTSNLGEKQTKMILANSIRP